MYQTLTDDEIRTLYESKQTKPFPRRKNLMGILIATIIFVALLALYIGFWALIMHLFGGDRLPEDVIYTAAAAKLFIFDLETTGLSPAKNGIHQIGFEIVIDGTTKEQADWKVQPNPKAIIEQEALDVAGVTKEQILAYPPMEEVYVRLTAMLGRYVDKFNKTDKFFLVGYNNAPFDNQFLRGFFIQNGDNYFGSWFWANSIDVMVLATQYLLDRRAKMENFKLATVAKEMGIAMDESKLHDASYDLYLTRGIYDMITKKG